MASGQEYITRGEFTGWRAEETEFRRGVKADLGEIIGLVRAQNGRVAKSETVIEGIRRDIEDIRTEDQAIQSAIESIQKDGCHQYENHQEAMDILEGSGVLPNTEGQATGPCARWPRVSDLNTKEKTVAGVGITALLIPAISDILNFGRAVFTWMASHGIR